MLRLSTALSVGLAFAALAGCSSSQPPAPQAAATPPAHAMLGSPEWQRWVGQTLDLDDDGHGPAPGSAAWNQAVQRKLGQEAPQSVPGSPQWQQSVDALLRTRPTPGS